MGNLASDLAIAATVEQAAAGDEVAFARIVAMHRAEMLRVAWSPDGTRIAIASEDGIARILQAPAVVANPGPRARVPPSAPPIRSDWR